MEDSIDSVQDLGDHKGLVSGDKQFALAAQSLDPDLMLFGNGSGALAEAGDVGIDLIANHGDSGLMTHHMVQTHLTGQGVQTALGTSQHGVSLAVSAGLGSHVDGPGSAQVDHSAVLHLDHANSGVFHIVGLVVPRILLAAMVDLALV